MNYTTKVKYTVLSLLFLLPFQFAMAQDDILDELEDDSVSDVFNYGMLINTQTTETVAKGSFELRIQHRFGALNLKDFSETVVDEFLGLDGSANIRFGFVYALSDDLQVGIGRTKINKVYDIEGKYRLWRQQETEGSPISVTLYFNTAVSTQSFPEVGPNEFFEDLATPFEYKFAHRLTYNTQVLLSKKFGSKFSLEFNPSLLYKNLVPAGRDNFVGAATLGARFKTGLTSSFIFEYQAKFNDRITGYKDPISFGYEIGTAGHAFQFFIASSNQIIDQGTFFAQPLDYTDGNLLIGFNIKRTFWYGND